MATKGPLFLVFKFIGIKEHTINKDLKHNFVNKQCTSFIHIMKLAQKNTFKSN